jgi:hypothetical protein
VLSKTLEGLLDNNRSAYGSLLWHLCLWDASKDVLESIAILNKDYPRLFGTAATG